MPTASAPVWAKKSVRRGRARPPAKPKSFEQRVAEAFADLFGHLTPEGRRVFMEELSKAVNVSREATSDVVEAWYRTFDLRHDPDYFKNMEEAGKLPRKGQLKTVEGIRAELGL